MGPVVLLLTLGSSLLVTICQAPDVALDSCTVLNWLPSLLSELHTFYARHAWPGSDASMQEPHAWEAGRQLWHVSSPACIQVFSLHGQAAMQDSSKAACLVSRQSLSCLSPCISVQSGQSAALCCASCLLVHQAVDHQAAPLHELHSSGDRRVETHKHIFLNRCNKTCNDPFAPACRHHC